MHLDAERIERLLAGELAPALAISAREHLVTCNECQDQVAQARESETRIHALLGALDHPMQRPSVAAVTAGATPRGRSWLRWAAAIVLAVAVGGVAYATPVTGVRAFIESLLRRPGAPVTPDSATATPGEVVPAVSGIAVRPGRRLVIEFAEPTGSGSVRVMLNDADEVEIRAPAGAATFSSEADRVVIEARAPVVFNIAIPRSAPRVELRVGRRRIFLKDGERVTTSGGTELGGAWTLPLGGVR